MTGGSQGPGRVPPGRSWRTVAARGLFVCALDAVACGGASAPTRGYGSHQLEATRDGTLSFLGSPGPGVLTYETGGPIPADETIWTLNLATGAVQNFGSQYPPSSMPGAAPGPYSCSEEASSDGSINTYTLVIVDNSSGTETDFADVVSYAQCPGADGTLAAFVDASGSLALFTGPLTDLQPVPLALAVSLIGWWNIPYDSATSNAPTGVTVQGALPSTPDQVGLYTIDLASYAIATDIPATPASAAWATGATPAGSLQSTTLSSGTYSVFPRGDHYLYPRLMSDGGTTMFAGPFSSGAASELALFQVPPGTTPPIPNAVPSGQTNYQPNQSFPQLVSWQLGGAAGASSDLIVWDDTNRQLIACPSSANASVTGQPSSDGSKVLFVTPQSCCSYQGSGPLSLLTLAGGVVDADSCAVLASSNVVTAAFSPDSSFMFWLVGAADQMQLWIAASDGSGAHMVGSGVMQNVHFIASDGARLELILDGDLVWFDLHDSSLNLHYVAEQVFEEIYDTGGAWLITGYEYSTQDNSGTLGLVNRDTGEKRPLSPDVAQFTIMQGSVAADGGIVTDSTDAGVTPVLSVVYLVRGRNPSPQDGIWLATLTAADFK